MKEKILNKIKEINAIKCIKNIEKDSYVFFAFPYQPFDYNEFKDNKNLKIDSYYFESNRSYHIIKKIKQNLSEEYSINIEKFSDNIKRKFLENNLATMGNNSLLYFGKNGSYCILHIFIIKDVLLNEFSEFEPPIKMNCDLCKKCESVCKNCAIKNYKVFPEKCLRSYMEGEIIPVEYFNFLSNKFMGCNECQLACPYNKIVSFKSVDDSIKKLFYIDHFLYAINNNIFDDYKIAIGANLARKKVFVANLKNLKLLDNN